MITLMLCCVIKTVDRMSTPLSRSSQDMCISGLKGSGKSYYTSIMSYELYKQGYEIFSNYTLNFPFTFIASIEDLMNITPKGKGIMILDDAERWISCRTWTSRKVQNIMEIILNMGKKGEGVSLWYTCKIFENVDKWLRDCTDMVAETSLQMIDYPATYEEYDDFNILENLALIIQYIRIDGKPDSIDVIWNLHEYKNLYDTKELIRDIKKK